MRLPRAGKGGAIGAGAAWPPPSLLSSHLRGFSRRKWGELGGWEAGDRVEAWSQASLP